VQFAENRRIADMVFFFKDAIMNVANIIDISRPLPRAAMACPPGR
jgi:hypothetical protein